MKGWINVVSKVIVLHRIVLQTFIRQLGFTDNPLFLVNGAEQNISRLCLPTVSPTTDDMGPDRVSPIPAFILPFRGAVNCRLDNSRQYVPTNEPTTTHLFADLRLKPEEARRLGRSSPPGKKLSPPSEEAPAADSAELAGRSQRWRPRWRPR
ncbi:hypothetical protein DPX16_0619 [Anabarilius grahami]|uniref:Uncharacterized protein n=1 Tax=Anabarilius grahami TaxID=495550 RepID=A0A3N0YJE7_ANAGA|nr:hypothetical protein DPX16_0619 [Anabarilius grahami]